MKKKTNIIFFSGYWWFFPSFHKFFLKKISIYFPIIPKNYTVRKHKICVLLRCFRPSTPGTCRSSALHDADFMPSDSATSNGENFFIFKAD